MRKGTSKAQYWGSGGSLNVRKGIGLGSNKMSRERGSEVQSKCFLSPSERSKDWLIGGGGGGLGGVGSRSLR